MPGVTWASLFSSGHAIDIVLGFVAVEALLLAFWKKWGGAEILGALLPGVFLLLGVRAALTDAPWFVVSLWITASLPAHLLDLRRRAAR